MYRDFICSNLRMIQWQDIMLMSSRYNGDYSFSPEAWFSSAQEVPLSKGVPEHPPLILTTFHVQELPEQPRSVLGPSGGSRGPRREGDGCHRCLKLELQNLPGCLEQQLSEWQQVETHHHPSASRHSCSLRGAEGFHPSLSPQPGPGGNARRTNSSISRLKEQFKAQCLQCSIPFQFLCPETLTSRADQWAGNV